MNFPQIRIQSQSARIGMDSKDAELTMQQPNAQVSIQQPKADLSIKQKKGKLSIDQTNAWNNIGLKSSFVRTRETADHARQALLEGIARISQEGDELMRIENDGNPIAAQAERNARYEFFVQHGGMPTYDLVNLSYEVGGAEIDVRPNKPVIDVIPQKPQINYTKGDVSIYIEQYPELNIDFDGLKYVGYRFETEI
ncbi:DUF6470 family protein [Thalassobacillus hwangdonensis]|uniref:DUF6470 family protein n=1 Tax=Thalassobacillus hwangdonensis TaxID=546108 RepID=A0ABW3L6B8_9BACI